MRAPLDACWGRNIQTRVRVHATYIERVVPSRVRPGGANTCSKVQVKSYAGRQVNCSCTSSSKIVISMSNSYTKWKIWILNIILLALIILLKNRHKTDTFKAHVYMLQSTKQLSCLLIIIDYLVSKKSRANDFLIT